MAKRLRPLSPGGGAQFSGKGTTQATPPLQKWLADRRLKQEGEEYADAMGRVTEAVNRRVPQLRWAGAERQQVLRAGDQMVRNTMESGVAPGFVPAQRRPRAAASGVRV